MVTGASQRNALNQTALVAADAIERWSKMLIAKMEKQGISRRSKETAVEGKSKYVSGPTDDIEPVTFSRGEIRMLLDGMDSMRKKLRRFEKLK